MGKVLLEVGDHSALERLHIGMGERVHLRVADFQHVCNKKSKDITYNRAGKGRSEEAFVSLRCDIQGSYP